MTARVFLNETLIGELQTDPAGAETTFQFDASYALAAERPVFGRWFEDRLIEPPRTFRGVPLPNYFRNLLPEGALRKLVMARLGASSTEYAMLLRLGGDLPGAVRIVSDELESGPVEESERNGRVARDPYRFALTGVQAKLTLFEDRDHWTLPIEGQEGHWIAKFGSPAYQRLVENESTMLGWAHACGLDVPEHRVIPASSIRNLPADFAPDQEALLVRRFDRSHYGRRIHQEDFAQVFDIPPEERYAWESVDLGWAHYGSIGAVIHQLCGEPDFREYMRRLVFMVLSGNADAHLKNWALIYPNALKARLAPVYDFVSTLPYSHPEYSALHWLEPPEPTAAAPKRLCEVSIDDLLAVASCAPEAGTSELFDDLAAFVGTVRASWQSVASDAPEVVRERIEAHLRACALK